MNIRVSIIFILIMSIGFNFANAQVGIGTETPHASATLDLTSSSQGFLPPRMTEAQRNNITTPATGLIIYCTNCGTDGELQVYNGAAWTNVVGDPATAGPALSIFCTSGPTEIIDVTNPSTEKIWMDRNLGAIQVANSSTDEDSYGDLYQWGRAADGHQCRDSSTYSTVLSTNGVSNFNNDQTNQWHGQFILRDSGVNNWVDPSVNGINDLWQGANGTNNPCPSGYRLPTDTELNEERISWGSTNGNNASGAFGSPLKLPLAGLRQQPTGAIDLVAIYGFYWSSTVSSNNVNALLFENSSASMMGDLRSYGLSARCIKD